MTCVKKKGVVQFFQPPFTREFELTGGSIVDSELWQMLKGKARYIQFRNQNLVPELAGTARKHQYIELNKDSINQYSTNARRLVKKASQNFDYRISESTVNTINLVRTFLAPKISEFTAENIAKLEQLMKNALTNDKGELIEIYDGDDCVGAGFFFCDGHRITYLKGVADEDSKKKGAMFGLIDFAVKKYNEKYDVLDFGGSDVENVARFYKKFGAKDRLYYNYEIDQLPVWYKLAKTVAKRTRKK